MSKHSNDIKDFLSDEESKHSVSLGATPDSLDYKKLFGLFFAGIFLTVVLIIIAVNLFNYYAFKQSQNAAESAVFYELQDIKNRDHEILTTFGVVDAETGTYRVPVDSAVTLVLEDYAN